MNKKTKRTPRAFAPDDAKVVSREREASLNPEILEIAPPEERPISAAPDTTGLAKGIKWGSLLIGAIGGLILMAAGIWLNDLVAGLFSRNDWVGWVSLGLLGAAILAVIVIVMREVWAILRLRKLGRIRQDAESAIRQSQKPLADTVTKEIRGLYRNRRDLAWARARLDEHANDIMDAKETLALVERELISQLDQQAQSIIATTAKRVSVVTAISPVAIMDMAIVAVQNMRMLRQIAIVYGARPGTLGLIRLARMVITHIVLTGGIALGDDLVQQLIGHRLMAKLSARLGEGLFNGALTARIGLAAMDVSRPLPHIVSQPPRMRTLLSELARQVMQKT